MSQYIAGSSSPATGSHPSTPVHGSSTPTESSQPSNPLGVAASPAPVDGFQTDHTQSVAENATDGSHNLDEEESCSLLLGKRKLTSVVWEHFERVKIGEEYKAICKYCKKKLGGGSKNGTRHLHSHIKICPRRKLVDMRQKVLVSSFDKAAGKVQVSNYTFDEEFARRALASMIITHEYPLSIVDHIWFRKYCCALQPLFKVPTRNTIRSDIMKIYEHEKHSMLKFFEKLESRVALTTDMWTSTNQKKSFMVVTAHYVDDSWILQSRIIRFVYVPCPHTKEVLCEVLWDTIDEWGLYTKLSTVTVDNCSSNDAMMELLLEKLDSNRLMLNGSFIHMRCCAHILNLVVKDGLDVIKRGVEKIRDSVVYWRGTPKREEKFEETARHLKVPFTKKLVLDCSTRWNSTFLMLETALSYKKVFARLKHRDSQYKTLPTEDEWEWAKDICQRLRIFHKVTQLFSGTKYPTANMYFQKLCDIRVALSDWLRSPNKKIRQMSKNMVEKFDKYWTVIHGIMGVAAVLDPRYKMGLIEFYFPLLFGSDHAEYQVQRVRQLCSELLQEYQCTENATSHDPSIASSHSGQSTSSSVGIIDVTRTQLQEFLLKKKKNSVGKSELDHYFEDDVLPDSPDFDILSWWKVSGVRYPTLWLMARDIIAIPVSTVASESAFSTSGRLVSPNRSRLNANTVEALMCAQNWLWGNEMQGELHNYATVYEDELHEDNDEDIEM